MACVSAGIILYLANVYLCYYFAKCTVYQKFQRKVNRKEDLELQRQKEFVNIEYGLPISNENSISLSVYVQKG